MVNALYELYLILRLQSITHMAVTRRPFIYIVSRRLRRPIPSWPYHLHMALPPRQLFLPTHPHPHPLYLSRSRKHKIDELQRCSQDRSSSLTAGT